MKFNFFLTTSKIFIFIVVYLLLLFFQFVIFIQVGNQRLYLNLNVGRWQNKKKLSSPGRSVSWTFDAE